MKLSCGLTTSFGTYTSMNAENAIDHAKAFTDSKIPNWLRSKVYGFDIETYAAIDGSIMKPYLICFVDHNGDDLEYFWNTQDDVAVVK